MWETTSAVVLTMLNLISAIWASSVTREGSAIGVVFTKRYAVKPEAPRLVTDRASHTRGVHFEFHNSETVKLDRRF